MASWTLETGPVTSLSLYSGRESTSGPKSTLSPYYGSLAASPLELPSWTLRTSSVAVTLQQMEDINTFPTSEESTNKAPKPPWLTADKSPYISLDRPTLSSNYRPTTTSSNPYVVDISTAMLSALYLSPLEMLSWTLQVSSVGMAGVSTPLPAWGWTRPLSAVVDGPVHLDGGKREAKGLSLLERTKTGIWAWLLWPWRLGSWG
jgi:hypothetical protein